MKSQKLLKIGTHISGWKKASILGAGCLALILGEANQCEAQIAANSRYQSLVSSGEAVPTGGNFTTMGKVVMSSNGEWIGFEGFHTAFGGVDRGIFRYSTVGGNVNRIIGDKQTLTNGIFSMALANRTLAVNDSGTVAFNGNLTGSSNGFLDDTGFFSGSGGAVTEMVREGNSAPGGLGGTFQNFGSGLSDVQFRGINNSGNTFFGAIISDSPGGFTDDNRFFRVGNGAPFLLACAGDPAPPPSGGDFNVFTYPAFNDIGQAVIAGSTIGATPQASAGKLWFVDSSGGMSELAFMSVSGGTSTSVGSLVSIASGTTINNSDDVVFAAWTSAGGTGPSDSHVFRISKSGGPISVLLSEGAAAPDGNGEFANMINIVPRLNDAGQYASGFDLRNTSGGTTDDSGIFRVDLGGNVVQMFREGQSALSGNGTFGALNGATNFAYNSAGNVAMQTTYQGTSGGGTDNVAIVISDGIDSFEVAREGNMVNGQTVLGLAFMNGVYGNDRSTSGLNDFGQVAYYQTTTGGGRSIELWTPELHHRGGTNNFSDGSNWTLSLGPAHVHDVFMDSATNSVVTATGTNTVRNCKSVAERVPRSCNLPAWVS